MEVFADAGWSWRISIVALAAKEVLPAGMVKQRSPVRTAVSPVHTAFSYLIRLLRADHLGSESEKALEIPKESGSSLLILLCVTQLIPSYL